MDSYLGLKKKKTMAYCQLLTVYFLYELLMPHATIGLPVFRLCQNIDITPSFLNRLKIFVFEKKSQICKNHPRDPPSQTPEIPGLEWNRTIIAEMVILSGMFFLTEISCSIWHFNSIRRLTEIK